MQECVPVLRVVVGEYYIELHQLVSPICSNPLIIILLH